MKEPTIVATTMSGVKYIAKMLGTDVAGRTRLGWPMLYAERPGDGEQKCNAAVMAPPSLIRATPEVCALLSEFYALGDGSSDRSLREFYDRQAELQRRRDGCRDSPIVLAEVAPKEVR